MWVAAHMVDETHGIVFVVTDLEEAKKSLRETIKQIERCQKEEAVSVR